MVATWDALIFSLSCGSIRRREWLVAGALQQDLSGSQLTDELIHLRVCLSLAVENGTDPSKVEAMRARIFALEQRFVRLTRQLRDRPKQARSRASGP